MAGPKSENSKKDRRVYREMRAAGASREAAEAAARDSIPKRRVPAGSRPNDEHVREKGG